LCYSCYSENHKFFEIISLCDYIKKAGTPSPADSQCDSNAPTPESIRSKLRSWRLIYPKLSKKKKKKTTRTLCIANGCQAFWDERNKKSPTKSLKKAAETASKRNSIANASDADGSASVAQKRGRKALSVKPADREDDEWPTKKSRKTSKKTPVTSDSHSDKTKSLDLSEDEKIGTMEQQMHAPSWDKLIKDINTVERVDGVLHVYFTSYVLPLSCHLHF
jgi:hypothetical protein